MAKVNFTKVEDAFDKAAEKLFIDNLAELAAIADLTQDPKANLSSKAIEEIITRFQKELNQFKKQDPKLFEQLNLTKEDEERFALSSANFTQEDWLRLKTLKLRIEELKKELHGKSSDNAENETIVTKERKKHINKRTNAKHARNRTHTQKILGKFKTNAINKQTISIKAGTFTCRTRTASTCTPWTCPST